MNTKLRIMPLMLSLALVVGVISCDKKTDENHNTGKLEFNLAMSENLSALKSSKSDSININDTIIFTSYQLLITVAGENGEFVFEDKLVPIYRFGDGFVSEQIEIKAGGFYLKKFMILDNYGQVVYASPLEGSSRAYLVNQTLPLYFTISPDKTTQLAPEVLPVEGYTPSDFGYASFLVQVVNPLTFYLMVQFNNPGGTTPNPVTIHLGIYTPDDWNAGFRLDTGVNILEVRSAESYQLTVYRNGNAELRYYISYDELVGTSMDNPYIIVMGTVPYHTIILQPGPDDGKDAWLTDLAPDANFGSYKYFEGSFLSDSILTVMRTTRSLIAFDLGQLPKSAVISNVTLTLYYDIPIPWPFDSTWFWRNKKCNCILSGAALQQVIEPWEENAVTWNNQPQTTEINQVLIYPFVKNANFIDLDVTSIFVPNPYIDSVPFPNYGMMLKLYPDESQPGFRFVSSDYPDDYMRPRLTINYTLPDSGTFK
jgi:hypothetical protein